MDKKTYNQKLAAYEAQMQSGLNVLAEILKEGDVADAKGDYEDSGAFYNMAVELFPKNEEANEKRLDAIQKNANS